MMTTTTLPANVGNSPLALESLQGLAELRLLPSRILHASRVEQYDPDGHWRALLEHSPDPAVVHRHWSTDILEALGIDDSAVPPPRHNALPVALLPAGQFETLATWLGIQLCAARLRTFIQKQDLHPLLTMPHADHVRKAQRHTPMVHYSPTRDWDGARIARDHIDLGRAALLHACDGADPVLRRLLALKLPETQSWPDLPEPDMLIHACLEFLDE